MFSTSTPTQAEVSRYMMTVALGTGVRWPKIPDTLSPNAILTLCEAPENHFTHPTTPFRAGDSDCQLLAGHAEPSIAVAVLPLLPWADQSKSRSHHLRHARHPCYPPHPSKQPLSVRTGGHEA